LVCLGLLLTAPLVPVHDLPQRAGIERVGKIVDPAGPFPLAVFL
jgi:hypothetical protein